ncbi:unnamed protein product [Arabidopsis thaliana]|uniref:YTH domain-containing protein n=1 Tax=Arabidopsis thaliana TaxID=3702 RepID=Q9LUT8_ARATH|nr:unnamed protein product [Arabidopsis thaliana]
MRAYYHVQKLGCLTERIISLAFDVISRVMEIGPDISEWEEDADEFIRKNLPSELEIIALSFWQEEISGWRDDLFTARKSAMNLLCVLAMSKGPPVSTTNTASPAACKRKKGEKNRGNNQRCMGDLLVLPFLSKFPVPSKSYKLDASTSAARLKVYTRLSYLLCKTPQTTIKHFENLISGWKCFLLTVLFHFSISCFIPFYFFIKLTLLLCRHVSYFGVLMAYGSLQEFIQEQNPEYVASFVRTRVLPIYSTPDCSPYLVASANWVLGELASCLPEEMNADVFSSLLKALAMPDQVEISCYPVRFSAAGGIGSLLENEYQPPELLPLLQFITGKIGNEEDEDSMLFQLLKSVVESGNQDIAMHIPYIVSSLVSNMLKFMHPSEDPWSQAILGGLETLAAMTQTYESSKPEADEENNQATEIWLTGQGTISKALSALLQHAWLATDVPPTSCIDHLSTMLRFIVIAATNCNVFVELRLTDLLIVWADILASWNGWEESEDLSVFDCIEEVVGINNKYGFRSFLFRDIPSPPAMPVRPRSVVESIGSFVSKAILEYPSATRRACSCVHTLLYVPDYSSDIEGVGKSLAMVFAESAFSHFLALREKPCTLWRPLLLAISSCYISYSDIVEGVLEKVISGGFELWVSSLAFSYSLTCDDSPSVVSEVKLYVMTLVKVIEHLLDVRHGNATDDLARKCFVSLMEASRRLKEVNEETDDDEDDGEPGEEETESEETDSNDEDSESDECEETEEEFLERYAKVAAELEDSEVIEEADEEDDDHEIDLANLLVVFFVSLYLTHRSVRVSSIWQNIISTISAELAFLTSLSVTLTLCRYQILLHSKNCLGQVFIQSSKSIEQNFLSDKLKQCIPREPLILSLTRACYDSSVGLQGGQNENAPYICYTPSYGYAQSPYNPYNPYIPGASIGVDSSFVGFQQYYSDPPYESAASSPTYVPYVIQPDMVSNSSTDSLVANGGQSDGRGSMQRNGSAIAGLPKDAPKSTTTGQYKQPGIPKNVSTTASAHSLQGKTAYANTLLPYGKSDIANGVSSIASYSYKPCSKIYDARGDNNTTGSTYTSEQNRGSRTRRSRNQLIVKAYTTKAGNADAEGNIVINPDRYNKEDFSIEYSDARFFVIKSYSEDDVHKSIKYGVWSSTLNGNKKLQSVYEDAQRIATEKSRECPIFLFFSVNSSGLFCGVAEMTGPVSFDRDMDFWQQDKWSGSFPVKWHIIKDVPNSYFRHIILHNNENKPVTNSRDTQEIILKQGLEVLKLFKHHAEKTSLLDDFMYYEDRQRLMQEERARLPFRTFRRPFPVLNLDFSDRSKKSSKDVVKKPSVTSAETKVVQLKNSDGDEKSNTQEATDDSTPSTLKFGSLAIKPTAGTTFNPTQPKPKPTPSLGSDHKSDSSEEVTGSLADDIVSVGSLPIKVKGSKELSSKIAAVGTSPLSTQDQFRKSMVDMVRERERD